jgi:hypothetical protein
MGVIGVDGPIGLAGVIRGLATAGAGAKTGAGIVASGAVALGAGMGKGAAAVGEIGVTGAVVGAEAAGPVRGRDSAMRNPFAGPPFGPKIGPISSGTSVLR